MRQTPVVNLGNDHGLGQSVTWTSVPYLAEDHFWELIQLDRGVGGSRPRTSMDGIDMDLAAEAGRRYMAHVSGLVDDPALDPETRRSATLLAETLKAALEARSSLQPGDVRFGSRSLDKVPTAERLLFVNEFSLGVGSGEAAIVAMGTEPAENVDDPEELSFHCLYPVLILCGSRLDVLRRIGEGSAWEHTLRRPWDVPRRPYHLNPDDLLEVARRGAHTWSVLAKVVVPEEGAWRTLLGGQSLGPGLGEHVYQIDRSALPARRQEAGQAPSSERVAFMTEVVIPALRPQASVLLLHGFAGGRWRYWQPRDYAVIATFLGLPAGQPFELNWDKVGRESLGWIENDDRLAVFARALNGRISGAYIAAVRGMVRDHLARRSMRVPCRRGARAATRERLFSPPDVAPREKGGSDGTRS